MGSWEVSHVNYCCKRRILIRESEQISPNGSPCFENQCKVKKNKQNKTKKHYISFFFYHVHTCSFKRSTIAPYYMMHWNLTHSQIYLHRFESNYCWVQGMRSYSNHQTIVWFSFINYMHEFVLYGRDGLNVLKCILYITWANMVILWLMKI